MVPTSSTYNLFEKQSDIFFLENFYILGLKLSSPFHNSYEGLHICPPFESLQLRKIEEICLENYISFQTDEHKIDLLNATVSITVCYLNS